MVSHQHFPLQMLTLHHFLYKNIKVLWQNDYIDTSHEKKKDRSDRKKISGTILKLCEFFKDQMYSFILNKFRSI